MMMADRANFATPMRRAALWHQICETQNIHPNLAITWRDIFLQRDRVLRQRHHTSSHSYTYSTSTHHDGLDGDEGWESEAGVDLEDLPLGDLPESPTRHAGPGISLLERRTSPRGGGLVGLPMFLSPANKSSGGGVGGNGNGGGLGGGMKNSTTTPADSLDTIHSQTFPLPSHTHAPHPRPSVNYKHFYLLRRILSCRFQRGDNKSFVLDHKSSILSGGLEGHKEGIYCLEVLNCDLSFKPKKVLEGEVSSNNRRASFDGSSTLGIIESRNWILSGSRDRTVRLWDINTGKVAKIYSSETESSSGGSNGHVRGHTGSVLTLCVKPLPSSSSETIKKIRMVSGGSDGKLIVWDVVTGKIEAEIQAHEKMDGVFCVRFDERRIVSCSKGA